MTIREEKDKRKHMVLLLLADEQEEMVMKYLDRGTMYVLEDGGCVCAECVVTDEGEGTLEIKNLAVSPHAQKKGYGRALIDFVANRYAEQYDTLLVGTGDSPLTVPFYEKCGFARSGVIFDFFTKNYDHPIIEEGILLKDMILFSRSLKERK